MKFVVVLVMNNLLCRRAYSGTHLASGARPRYYLEEARHNAPGLRRGRGASQSHVQGAPVQGRSMESVAIANEHAVFFSVQRFFVGERTRTARVSIVPKTQLLSRYRS